MTEYVKRKGRLPKCLVFSFAAYIAFYRAGQEMGEGKLIGKRGGDTFEISDDQWVLDFYYGLKGASREELVHAVVENERMWGAELKELPGFEEAVLKDLADIDEKGMYEAMKAVIA